MIARIIVNLAKKVNPMTSEEADQFQNDIEADLQKLPIVEKGKKPGDLMEWLGVISRHWLFKLLVMFGGFLATKRLLEAPEADEDPDEEVISRMRDILKSR